ncbi:MAG: 50S ribosomal protein L18e [Nanoarchaeota archaeon]
MKRTGPSNYQVQSLLQELQPKVQQSRFWRRIAEDIAKPSRQRREVNVYKIDKYTREGETVVVPGKVLSMGELSKKVTVAALNFSRQAEEKIVRAHGKPISIQELLQQNPEGKNVRILG